MSLEEVVRRSLVALVKQAGTLIRKEELKRQALTASVNRPIVESLLQSIENKLATLPDLGKRIAEASAKALEEGKPVLETVFEKFVESLLQSLPLTITGALDEMKSLIEETNKQIEVANRILQEIKKAGIFAPNLSTITYKGEDYMSLYSALKVAKERLKTIKEFYCELEKVAAE